MLLSQLGYSEADTSAAEAASKDGRWARRMNCRIPGEISHRTLPSPIGCVVRDTSSSGARIELTGSRTAFSAGTERVPESITLTMPIDRMEVECRVTWRKGTMIGVRYLSPARPIPKRQVPRIGPEKSKDTGILSKLFK